jgi:hypothetical protein
VSEKSWSEYWPPVGPAGHCERSAVRVVSHDRCHGVEENAGQWRQGPGFIPHCTGELSDGMLPTRLAEKFTHYTNHHGQ